MFSKVFLFITVLTFISEAMATPFHECDEGPPPLSVDVEGCDEDPCTVVKGGEVVTDVNFIVPRDVASLHPIVTVSIGRIKIKVPLPKDKRDGCKSLINGGKCPLTKGEQITYRLAMPVTKLKRISEIEIKLALMGKDNKVLVCSKGSAKLVAPNARR